MILTLVSDPLDYHIDIDIMIHFTLCMYMHRGTLVYIYIYIYIRVRVGTVLCCPWVRWDRDVGDDQIVLRVPAKCKRSGLRT